MFAVPTKVFVESVVPTREKINIDMWFWHASFGHVRSLNDLNKLNISPFLESLVDGTFHMLEQQSHNIPFAIDGEVFAH